MLLLGGALAALVFTSGVASAQNAPDVPPSYSQSGLYQGPPNGGDQGPPQDGGYRGPQVRGAPTGYGDDPVFRFDENFDTEKFFYVLRLVDLRYDQRRAVRDIRNSTDDRPEQARRILGLLDREQRHQLFLAMRYDHGVPRERDGRGAAGRVGSFDRFDMQLEDGTHVHLHQGTIINPTGFTLHRGVHVAAEGHYLRDGTLEADEIDVTPPPEYARY